MFQKHTTRRYLQGSAQKFKTIAPTYLAPITLTQINTTALIGFTTLGALCLFQRAERKRWKNKNDEVLIDVTASLSD